VAEHRSILLVAQHTPPSTLSGARRPAGLAKYLSRRGHHVTVLTSIVSGRGAIAGAERVLHTRDLMASRLNWRRGHLDAIEGRDQAAASGSSPVESLVVPDLALVGWLPFALAGARSLARRHRFDCVITTSPPQSAHLVGLALQRRGIPWLADLRDGWTFDPPRPPWPARAQHAADRALERAALSRADGVVAVTAPIADDLAARLGRPVTLITNGFDPEEAAGDGAAGLLMPGRHSIVHTGRANVSGRSLHPLLDGVAELLRRTPAAAERLEVVLAGPTTGEERELLNDDRLAGTVRSVGTLGRPRALALQRSADSLVVLADGASSRSVATNKLFEYLAAGRPVLVLGDGTEAARIVVRERRGIAVPSGDAGAVAGALERLMAGEVTVAEGDLGAFAWPSLAERFEQEIEAAIAARR
jgi:glycosyltransferase involved in cell wall biosynthesis